MLAGMADAIAPAVMNLRNLRRSVPMETSRGNPFDVRRRARQYSRPGFGLPTRSSQSRNVSGAPRASQTWRGQAETPHSRLVLSLHSLDSLARQACVAL